MFNSIIEVNNLSKNYTISHEPVPTCTGFFGMKSGGRERYTVLRDVMAQKAKKISVPSQAGIKYGQFLQTPRQDILLK